MGRLDAGRALGFAAALAWVLLGVRWFDAGVPLRGDWLGGLPPLALAVPAAALGAGWLFCRRRSLWPRVQDGDTARLLTLVALALAFRLPLAWHAAAGYTTADGALSGLVALHLREGGAHDVFVPQVPYSGSLKSHLTVVIGALVPDLPRAFTLASLLLYGLYVAGIHRLAVLAGAGSSASLAAGLYAAFAPAFVTRYSLSNDGNYVEVLALGTWAAVCLLRWAAEPDRRGLLALVVGLLLGLALWCHILAVIYVAAAAAWLLATEARAAVARLPALLTGLASGYFPGLLWNARHGWESFRALVPGLQPASGGPEGPGLPARAWGTLTDHLPTLLGYDPGYPALADLALRAVAWLAVASAAWAVGASGLEARRRSSHGPRLLVCLVAVNLAVAVSALRYLPGNPRYLLFLMTPLPILLAQALSRGWRRALLALLVACGAVGSVAQGPGEIEDDRRWRALAAQLETAGVRHCHTDFFVATMVNFLSEERVVCSAKLGPNRTEYFFEYRRRVDAAPEAALVAPTAANADKLERRLARLGVSYRRLDLVKPVLLPSRKVDPQELFPEQSFGLR